MSLEGTRALLTELYSSSLGPTREKRETSALPQGTPRHGWQKRRNGQYGGEPTSPPSEVLHHPAAAQSSARGPGEPWLFWVAFLGSPSIVTAKA